MKVSSKKAKGRRLQQWAASKVSSLLKMPWGADENIASREMGQNGVDIRLTPEALKKFPWSVECKNQENWSIPAWIRQAKENAYPNTDWLLITSRNNENPIIVLDANVFFELLKLIPGDKKGLPHKIIRGDDNNEMEENQTGSSKTI